MPKATAESWAVATRSKVRACETCEFGAESKKGRECLRFIDDVIAVRKERRSDVSLEALAKKLQADFAYPYSASGVRRHVRNCRGYAWRRVFLAR